MIVDIDHINDSSPLVDYLHIAFFRNFRYTIGYFKYTSAGERYKELSFGQCRIIHTCGCAVSSP